MKRKKKKILNRVRGKKDGNWGINKRKFIFDPLCYFKKQFLGWKTIQRKL
jgi:hypothetical protein